MIRLIAYIGTGYLILSLGYKIGGDTFNAGWCSYLAAEIACSILKKVEED